MMRKVLLPIVLLFLGSCCSMTQPGGCPPNVGAPTVCVDGQLNAHPNPIHAKRGQWIHFFHASAELDVDGDVFETKGHDGGQAWARVRKDAAYGSHKYSIINLTTREVNDPQVMIDP
jgi:hypothetical protein